MKTYYIYHIPGIKIGCTDEPKRRIQYRQGYTEWEILEEHTDIMVASTREQELQKEYGYEVDKQPYYKVIRMATLESTRKGAASLQASDKFIEVCSKGGKGNRTLTYEQAEEIRAKYIPRKYTAKMLAEEYNMSFRAIQKIIYYTSYKNK